MGGVASKLSRKRLGSLWNLNGMNCALRSFNIGQHKTREKEWGGQRGEGVRGGRKRWLRYTQRWIGVTGNSWERGLKHLGHDSKAWTEEPDVLKGVVSLRRDRI